MNTKPSRTHADEILSQLGGRNRLVAAIGAKDFFSDNNGSALVFKIGKGAKNSIGHIKIQLNAMDTYDLTFTKFTRKKHPDFNIFVPDHKVVSEHKGIYLDDLHSTIEEETGFYLNPFPKIIIN